MMQTYPIGIFDSGYGGLTVLKSIREVLPDYDFLYLGDNARAPYGTQSFAAIYHNTRECVAYLFSRGCPLVILACNTASARALRIIQQRDLTAIQQHPQQKVLGVIRPTAEIIGQYSHTKAIGILGTSGTVKSLTYVDEIQHFHPELAVYQQACPAWVDFIEAGQHHTPQAQQQIAADIAQLLQQDPNIDCVLLACTHYPLVADTVREVLPSSIRLLEQGDIVAQKTLDYLARHTVVSAHCSRDSTLTLLTTGEIQAVGQQARCFYDTGSAWQQAEIRGVQHIT